MAAEANQKRRKQSSHVPGPRKREQRVSFAAEGDTGTLTVHEGPPFRGREGIVGVLTVVIVGAGTLGLDHFGTVGAVVAAAVGIAIVAGIVLTAPPLRVTLTRAGDFIIYKSSPRRPKLAGRTRDLEVALLRGAEPRTWVGTLQFAPGGSSKDRKRHGRTITLPLLSTRDKDELKAMASWGNVQVSGD